MSTLLNLPIDTPLAEVEGASWWEGLDAVAQSITCEGCRKEALSLISAMHDLVNVRLGRLPYNKKNFQMIAREYATALDALPQCSPSQAERVEQCIQVIKAEKAQEGTSVNPWAVCQSSVGCALPHKQPASQEQEDEEFMDKLVEALKREGKLEQGELAQLSAVAWRGIKEEIVARSIVDYLYRRQINSRITEEEDGFSILTEASTRSRAAELIDAWTSAWELCDAK